MYLCIRLQSTQPDSQNSSSYDVDAYFPFTFISWTIYDIQNQFLQNQLNEENLTLLSLNTSCPVSASSVDPDQLASEEANWSGSALFVI